MNTYRQNNFSIKTIKTKSFLCKIGVHEPFVKILDKGNVIRLLHGDSIANGIIFVDCKHCDFIFDLENISLGTKIEIYKQIAENGFE